MQSDMPIFMEDQVKRAEEIVTAQGRATTATLERLMKVHYQTAVALLEELEMRGVLGPEIGRICERRVCKSAIA
jgi:Mn-dependent DtxR family transcriptional regulator